MLFTTDLEAEGALSVLSGTVEVVVSFALRTGVREAE